MQLRRRLGPHRLRHGVIVIVIVIVILLSRDKVIVIVIVIECQVICNSLLHSYYMYDLLLSRPLLCLLLWRLPDTAILPTHLITSRFIKP